MKTRKKHSVFFSGVLLVLIISYFFEVVIIRFESNGIPRTNKLDLAGLSNSALVLSPEINYAHETLLISQISIFIGIIGFLVMQFTDRKGRKLFGIFLLFLSGLLNGLRILLSLRMYFHIVNNFQRRELDILNRAEISFSSWFYVSIVATVSLSVVSYLEYDRISKVEDVKMKPLQQVVNRDSEMEEIAEFSRAYFHLRNILVVVPFLYLLALLLPFLILEIGSEQNRIFNKYNLADFKEDPLFDSYDNRVGLIENFIQFALILSILGVLGIYTSQEDRVLIISHYMMLSSGILASFAALDQYRVYKGLEQQGGLMLDLLGDEFVLKLSYTPLLLLLASFLSTSVGVIMIFHEHEISQLYDYYYKTENKISGTKGFNKIVIPYLLIPSVLLYIASNTVIFSVGPITGTSGQTNGAWVLIKTSTITTEHTGQYDSLSKNFNNLLFLALSFNVMASTMIYRGITRIQEFMISSLFLVSIIFQLVILNSITAISKKFETLIAGKWNGEGTGYKEGFYLIAISLLIEAFIFGWILRKNYKALQSSGLPIIGLEESDLLKQLNPNQTKPRDALYPEF